MTVSRVINGEANVKAATRDLVNAAITPNLSFDFADLVYVRSGQYVLDQGTCTTCLMPLHPLPGTPGP